MAYEVLIISDNMSMLGEQVADYFKAEGVSNFEQARSKLGAKSYHVIVWDTILNATLELADCKSILARAEFSQIPLVILTSSNNVKDKVKAFEYGCDDYIEQCVSADETCARITKSIFHQIANAQLSQRLEQATETARHAMVDNSDLGANIQFLLQVHECDNLDQLGQQFFATVQRYGLICSLQMRSDMGIKNMEAHGMAKDLESQLLLQLKDKGRYVDFGCRSIINYDRVSLLIKNMPLDDREKYGAIKDNTFCLVQGLNSRILALQDSSKLIAEKQALTKLSMEVSDVITSLQGSYQEVMRQIVEEVESATEKIQDRLPHLALTEEDEKFIDDIAEGLVSSTNQIFNEGLKVDELFEQLQNSVDKSLVSVEEPSDSSLASAAVASEFASSGPSAGNDKGQDNTVELF